MPIPMFLKAYSEFKVQTESMDKQRTPTIQSLLQEDPQGVKVLKSLQAPQYSQSVPTRQGLPEYLPPFAGSMVSNLQEVKGFLLKVELV